MRSATLATFLVLASAVATAQAPKDYPIEMKVLATRTGQSVFVSDSDYRIGDVPEPSNPGMCNGEGKQIPVGCPDREITWRHAQYSMLVETPDHLLYVISCDRKWRWSKCSPIPAGTKLYARRVNESFEVLYRDPMGKPRRFTYQNDNNAKVQEMLHQR